MKRTGIAAIMFLTFALAGARAGRAFTDSHDDGQPRTIHLIEREHDVNFLDLGAPGPSLGDRLVFTSDLFDEHGNLVGRDGADCVIVRIDPSAPAGQQQISQCTITVQLADGQITVQGLAQGTENFFAVTGGTGAYRTARGEAFAKDIVPLVEADITITLFR